MAGTLQAQHILSRVRNILQDNTGVRWTDGEMFDYLSDGQREIANFRPDATATHANVQLATGTEQTIPADGLRLNKKCSLGICLELLQMQQVLEHFKSKFGCVE